MQGNLLLAKQQLLYRLLKANAQTTVNAKKKPDWKCSSTPAVISGQTFKLHGFTRGHGKVSQCNVFLIERHVTTLGRLELHVTSNNLVWQEINSVQYSSFAIQLIGLVQVASIVHYKDKKTKSCLQVRHCVIKLNLRV